MQLEGLEQAQILAHTAMTPRARWLDRLDRYVLGTQYEGKVSFWSDCEKPLQERAPCIRYNITRSAVCAFRSNLVGEDHFPDVTSRNGNDDDDEGFSEEDSQAIDKTLAAISSQVRFQSVCGEAVTEALSIGSVAAIFGIRAKRLFVDITKAQWCMPTFDTEGAVSVLEIKYPYIDTNLLINGKYHARAMWYRRVIDDVTDTVYKPVEFKNASDPVVWTIDTIVSHNFGFCPVLWYAFERGCSTAGRIDGHAIHENLMQEIDELNMLLSIKHRAALFSEGQWTETGVEEGYNPTDPGRTPNIIIPSSPMGGTPTPDNPGSLRSGYLVPNRNASEGARKKGLHKVWQYPYEKTTVELHAMPGDALKAMAECATDERNKLSELLGVVFIDQENLPKGAAMSGTALTALRKRFYERCEEIRRDFGDGFIVPAYGMLLRIASKIKINLPSIALATAAIVRVDDIWSWQNPPFELSWGEHNTLTPDEQKALSETVMNLYGQNLLTDRVAVKMLRNVIGIEDVDGYLEELKTQVEEKQKTEQATVDDAHGKAMELQGQKFQMQAKGKQD